MKHSDVTMVRIYLTEGQHLLKQLLAQLHDEEKVRGVTVFRGISGFGRSGKMHSASLLDLSLDLPLVVSDNFAHAYGGSLKSLGRHQLRGLELPHELFTPPLDCG